MILALFLVITCSSISVSASDNSDLNDNWFSLFDYNDTSRDYTIYAGGTSIKDFEFPSTRRLYYVDIVIFDTNGADLNVVFSNASGSEQYNLTSQRIKPNYFRFYGYVYAPTYGALQLILSSKTNVKHVGSIVSCKVNPFGSNSTLDRLSYSCYLDNILTASGRMGSSLTPISFYHNSNLISEFKLEVYCENYKSYDFIDYVISTFGVSINSVTCISGSKYIPVDFTYQSSFVAEDGLTYSIYRIDLTSFNRNTDDIPKLIFTGLTSNEVTSGFILHSMTGYFTSDFVDPEIYWLQNISNLIDVWGLSLYGINEYVYYTLEEIVDFAESISVNVDWTYTLIENGFSSINLTLNNLTELMTFKLLDIYYSILDMSYDLSDKLTTINTTLTSKFDSTISTIKAQFENLEGWLSTGFESVVDSVSLQSKNTRGLLSSLFSDLDSWLSSGFKSVTDKLDVLINGTQEQQDAANQFKEDASDQSGQIDSALGNMNVAKPPADEMNTSVEAITGGLDFSPFNTALLTLSSSGTVYKLMFIAVTLMLVSYVFFGKKV